MSGILLSKSFGRQRHEIGRYQEENERLTGLQIRQTMIGRSFFAVVGTFFSITPALVYLVAGWQLSNERLQQRERRRHRRLHDAAVAAVLPDRLDAAGLDRRARVVRAVRSDLRVPRPGARDRGRARTRSSPGTTRPRAGRPRSRAVPLRGAARGAWSCRRPTSRSRTRRRANGRWTTCRSRSSPGSSPRSSGRAAPARPRSPTSCRASTTCSEGAVRIDDVDVRDDHARVARRHHRRGDAGDLPVPHHDPAQPAVRAARGDPGGDGGRRACREHPRPDRRAARGLRHGRGGARLQALGRREAAARDRARDPEGPADPDPRRGDVLARHDVGAAGAGGAGAADGGPHDDRDRPPAVDDPEGRRDLRDRPGPGRRARHARRAARPRRSLRHGSTSSSSAAG